MAHPLNPLSPEELSAAVALLNKHFGIQLKYNTINLLEPKKHELDAYKSGKTKTLPRQAYYVVLDGDKSQYYEGTLDLTAEKVLSQSLIVDKQPIIVPHDLAAMESHIRTNPAVIEQCVLSGVREDEMHKVYCDSWTIGYDERWGSKTRLQQCFMYFRESEDDSQYSHPLDFCPIAETLTGKVIYIDIPSVRRPLNRHVPHANFYPDTFDVSAFKLLGTESSGGALRDPVEIAVTQPKGVSFSINDRVINWQNFSIHVGFTAREGLVLSDISYNDHGKQRGIFHRISLAEMVVPYGDPTFPHHRKHAFDLGEYGGGLLTNPLALGCDCKGVIHYMDAAFVGQSGAPVVVKNAICIHEEDDGVLFKHSDFRDAYGTTIVTRGVKLVISHVFTAANYEYLVYWIFHQDGTIQLEVKLTGILNTYILHVPKTAEGSPDLANAEDPGKYGTAVYPGVNAHNHQHLFCLRIHPNIDNGGNSVAMVDAVASDEPVGSAENKYGNGFYAKKTVFRTPEESVSDYSSATGRTWDFFNPNSIHPYSKKPASYKLVSRECPGLLPKNGSLVWKRASFARQAMAVVPYEKDGVYPAGVHVPQTSGDSEYGLSEWLEKSKGDSIVDTDVVAYHTFGITHFPAPEDFPVMPAEPMTLLLRPRNFFTQNPCMDVPPSYACKTSEARAKAKSGDEIVSLTDKTSRLAFSNDDKASGCCGKCK